MNVVFAGRQSQSANVKNLIFKNLKMNSDEIIKNAQYRKGLSIAFFNATNAAISMCAGYDPKSKATRNTIVKLRDFFLEEHKKYYAEVISGIGVNYNTEAAMAKLQTAKSVDDLKNIWIGLSEDERQDKVIIEKAKTLKSKLS